MLATPPEQSRSAQDKTGCLHLPAFNAVIVGNGAIGGALLECLLANPRLNRVMVLGRRRRPADIDASVDYLRFDALDPNSISSAAAKVHQQLDHVHLLINTVGMLHSTEQQPEKRLRDVSAKSLQQSFMTNAVLLPLLAQSFSPLMRHADPAVLASLSARVGSIADNRLGGWYSYRASKAAHNMLLQTLSREWSLSHRNVSVVALHPGTVESPLSSPFISTTYGKRVLSAKESASALLAVIEGLRPGETGAFYDWQGHSIPW
ncbi:SDR family NAD(P)-dependent oxidoreductase [Pseudohalioglobus lutimaris]|uniref:Cell-cell signaling protein n=1 Tax=Pseudohalioglobus lutimaris TaxID=1737061 RepID=A0A2N5X057_9GAMM|nr:SDR family NAD(P)-dependent oxidoreductase [Pseudohalioglobus lutimaris]PLW67879.1 cell-cell signaling protein [Pseudohalioglobus lutimaris]